MIIVTFHSAGLMLMSTRRKREVPPRSAFVTNSSFDYLWKALEAKNRRKRTVDQARIKSRVSFLLNTGAGGSRRAQ